MYIFKHNLAKNMFMFISQHKKCLWHLFHHKIHKKFSIFPRNFIEFELNWTKIILIIYQDIIKGEPKLNQDAKNKNKTKNKPKFMIPSSKRREKSCELKIMPVIESYYSCIYSHFAYKINFVWIKWNRGVGMFYKKNNIVL